MPNILPYSEIKTIRFPVSLDTQEDVIITPQDFIKRPEKWKLMSQGRVDAIADALNAKRKEILKQWTSKKSDDISIEDADDWGFSPPAMIGHPDVSLFIDWIDLSSGKKNSRYSQALADTMRQICAIAPHDHPERIRNAFRSQFDLLNRRIISPRTDGHYQLGIRANCIAVINTEDRNYPVRIGDKSYDVLIPLSKKRRLRPGFTNGQIEQIAAAGLDGIAPVDLGRHGSIRSIRAKVSQMNAMFCNLGFQNLILGLSTGKLYFLDFCQPRHVAKCDELDTREASISTAARPGSIKT